MIGSAQLSLRDTLLFGLLSVAVWQDIRSGKVSNRLIATGLILGFALQVREHRIWGIYYFLGNISIPVILLYLLFLMRVLGAGDIKLFSMTGGMLTIGELYRCMVYSFIAAGFGAALFLVCDRQRRRKMRHAIRYFRYAVRTLRPEPYKLPDKTVQMRFAFAVFILFGTFAALYFPVQV